MESVARNVCKMGRNAARTKKPTSLCSPFVNRTVDVAKKITLFEKQIGMYTLANTYPDKYGS